MGGKPGRAVSFGTGGGARAGGGIVVPRASFGVTDEGGLVGGGFATFFCPIPLESLCIAATVEATRVPRTVVVLNVELFGSSRDSGVFVEPCPSDEDLG